jgi:hypothetical protein
MLGRIRSRRLRGNRDREAREDQIGVLVWTASHPRGLMALLASQKDERKV